MTVRTIAITALLATTVPLAAQQQTPGGGADPLRTQIMTFEDALRRAIEIAGEDLSNQVQQQLKTPVPIQFGFIPSVPVVRGWPLESYGFHFDVQVPDVGETGILVWRMWESRPEARMAEPQQPDRPARPIASGGAVIKDDPMAGAGPAPAPRSAAPDPAFDPLAVYRANVRAALIDAIINNPGALSLRDTDVLAVSAASVRQSPAYRLSPRSTRLTLYIRGADLIALRDGKLTREQVKQRITEKSF